MVSLVSLTAFSGPASQRQLHRKPTKSTHHRCKISAELGPSCGTYWGAHSIRGWQTFEGMVGRKLAIVHDYSLWTQSFPNRLELAAAHQGSVLFVDWSLHGSDLTWAQIAAGAANKRINAEAAAVKAFGHPIMVSFESEMDQPRFSVYGTPSQFVAAFRHIHKMFAADGAHNVIWVWNVTGDIAHAAQFSKLYPGNAYVDWIMWDPYNWYGCKGGAKTWRSFGQAVEPMYEWLTASSGRRGNGNYLSKPWGLGEFGTVEGPRPNSKALWFKNSVTQVKKNFPRLRALIYLDADDRTNGRTCDWAINSSKTSLAGFSVAGKTGYVSTMPFPHESDRLK